MNIGLQDVTHLPSFFFNLPYYPIHFIQNFTVHASFLSVPPLLPFFCIHVPASRLPPHMYIIHLYVPFSLHTFLFPLFRSSTLLRTTYLSFRSFYVYSFPLSSSIYRFSFMSFILFQSSVSYSST